MIKILLVLAMIAFSSLARAQVTSLPEGSFVVLQNFRVQGQALPAKFVQEFPVLLHQEVLRREKEFLNSLNGKCQNFVKVTFSPPIFRSQNETEMAFQAGLIKVEAATCYDDADPKDLMQISADADFKRVAFPTLKNIVSQDHQDCEWTYAPTIGKSHYCYLNFELEINDEVRSSVNFLTYNDSDPAFDAPVYFREALATARRMGTQTLYYVQSYVRASELSSFKQVFAENYIKQSQSQVFKKLEHSLRKNRTNP